MADRPNFLIFMTDQQRFDTVPPHKRAKTPNLNEFYKGALAFTRAYCPSPHCCPSRATFFSGLYPSEHGVWNNVDVGNALSRGLFDGVKIFSEDLKENGYHTVLCGKWHVSATDNPTDRGFDTSFPPYKYEKIEGYPPPSIFEWEWYKNLEEVEKNINIAGFSGDGRRLGGQLLKEGYPAYTLYGEKDNPFNDEIVVQAAENYIRNAADQDQPWCIFTGTLGPHDPYYLPQQFLNMYPVDEIELPENFIDNMRDKPNLYKMTRERYAQLTRDEYKECLRHYLAFCTYEDYLFGKLLDTLKQTGQYDNTVVIYLSDHGDYAAEHGLFAKGLPCFEGAYRIPLLIGGAAIEKPGREINEFVSLADLAPTILELAGIKFIREFSGKSLMPFIKDKKVVNWRDAVFTQTNGNELYGIQRSVTTDKWKYVYNGFDYDELYDLEYDRHEMKNLSRDTGYDNIKRELIKRIWQFAYEHKDVCINPYIMVSLAPYGPAIAFEKEQ